jgi:hypothetical protein
MGVGPVESSAAAIVVTAKLNKPNKAFVIINLKKFMRFLAQNVNCWDE